MIKSFRDKNTQTLFEGRCPRHWQAIRRVAERKLIQLNAAATLGFLQAPPGNRLEARKGDRAGQYSIRINDIVRERRGITADTALRLARYFGTDAQSWINLQTAYDLRVAELAAGQSIKLAVKPRRTA